MTYQEFIANPEHSNSQFRLSVGTRALTRAVPILTCVDEHEEEHARLALVVFRVLLTAWVASVRSEPELVRTLERAGKRAAVHLQERDFANCEYAARGCVQAASFLSNETTGENIRRSVMHSADANHDAIFGVLSPGTADIANGDFNAALDADVNRSHGEIITSSLWGSAYVPPWLKDFVGKRIDVLDEVPALAFWKRWYVSALNGAPLDWELQRDVALIPHEVWDEGPESVSEEIAKIEFKYRTSAVQRLVRNDEKGVFEPEEDALPPSELADFVSTRIENALKAALQSVSPNIFNENSYEVIVVRDTLASEPRSISILATGFYDAALALQKNNGTLYPEEVALTNLMNALGAATEELCELDEDAKRRCAVLAGYNPVKSVDDLPVEDLLLIPETVADQVSDPARKIIESDVERALSKERPPTNTIRIRLSNWLTTISIWMDRAMKGDKKAKWLADVVKRLRDWWPDE